MKVYAIGFLWLVFAGMVAACFGGAALLLWAALAFGGPAAVFGVPAAMILGTIGSHLISEFFKSTAAKRRETGKGTA